MAIDARGIPTGTVLAADICIVGAGAAGITIALELADSGLSVILAEAGGDDYDDATQSLYDGQSIGADIDTSVMRLRQLGGSTNHWGGRSRPLDAADFAIRPWVPHSGWPIGYAELAAHLPRALELCEIGSGDFSSRRVLGDALPFAPERLESGLWRFSPPTVFGVRYRPELEAAPDLRLLLQANLVDIELDDSHLQVRRLAFATLDGTKLAVSCRFAVLACGGLENPRQLLAARRQMRCGIGNGRDLVGRFFMGHPIWEPMQIQLRPGIDLPDLYSQALRGDGETEGMIRLGRAAQAELGTTCVDAAFYVGGQFGTPGVRAARRLWRAARYGQMPDGLGRDIARVLGDLDGLARAGMTKMGMRPPEPSGVTVSTLVEQAPDPESRVTLGEGIDVLGQPTLVVSWRIGEQDRRSVTSFCEVLATEVGRIGLGRARLLDWVTDPDLPMPDHSNSAHHIGTTRMSDDPARGVVDQDCRVHGMHNLFIAGSSVFPTGGSVHPTLNLVALAVRLAGHLRQEARAPAATATATVGAVDAFTP